MSAGASARGRAVALSLALALGGCAQAGARRAIAHAPHDPRAARDLDAAAPVTAGPRRTALQFELNERPFPSPLIGAMVGGQPATLIVDTGASHHIIARWFADELSLPLSNAADVGIDHTGRSVQVSRLDHASFALSGWGAVRAPTLLVVPVPDILHNLGIGGFLAPQALSSRGHAVVLNLRDGEMLEASPEDAVRSLTERFGPADLAELRACGGPSEGLELTTTASIEGFAVTLKVDSGASQSSVFAASPVGQRLSPRAAGGRSAYAASGRHTVPVLTNVRVRLGGLDTSADVDFLPGGPRATCPTDGFVGMDVLRTCVLILTENGGVAACAKP